MDVAPPGVRNLFRAALLLFVITVVIGILNGTDVWDPPHNTLLTHVHAGTLGWITLAVFGGAIWMFGSADDNSGKTLANVSIVAIALYVLAFWSVELTTDSIQRPIGGTLAFIAMVWMFVWALRKKRGTTWDVAELGMALALGFLVIGAVLGVLLGLQLADVEIVDPAKADQLFESHPGAMVAGFVILAGLALIEWLMPGRRVPKLGESRMGVVQMLLLFVAGILFVIGSLFAIDPLLQGAGALQLIGALVLIGRFRRQLAPSQWSGPPVNQFVRTAVVGMIVSVGLVVYLISQISTGKEFADVMNVGIAFDHINFLMVVTNLVFAMMIMAVAVPDSVNRIVYWGVNIGVVGFAVGLIAENAVLKRIFTPILGLALLYGIYKYSTAESVRSGETVRV
jgi:predicted membrane protein